VSPAFLEKLCEGPHPRLARWARQALRALERALPFVLAAGLVLPTMHQSTLGSLLLVAESKLHGLWHTPLLPLLFLLTSFTMGYAVILVEAIFSSVAFRRPLEMRLLHPLGRVVAGVSIAWLAIRSTDLVWAGRADLVFTAGWPAAFFLLEVLATLAAAALLGSPSARTDPGRLLQGAGMALLAGGLYRVDTFLVAFNPGRNFAYFPSVPELTVSLGLIATETMVYVFVVKNFPILAGVARAPARPAAAAAPPADAAHAG
jgi:Ni/Fe-hydrogenase subunit HybB-like protein